MSAIQPISNVIPMNETKKLLRLMTCGSVDDGKSTLIGRLLYDTQSLFDDQLALLEDESKRIGNAGDALDFSLLVDGLQSEREQGITIDVAYRYFSTDQTKFIIADSPGHEQYTRNMVTAASHSSVALILIDARKGVITQTKRHAYLCSLMGIETVIVAVNKIDLVDYQESVYESIKQDFLQMSHTLAFRHIDFVPVSALHGDNIASRSEQMPWYQGEFLLRLLDNMNIRDANPASESFRFPVQYVNRPDQAFRGFSGTVVSGTIRQGDEILVLPSQKRANVTEIVTFDGNLSRAVEGEAITLVLDREIDISRGDVVIHAHQEMTLGHSVKAELVWLNETALQLDRQYDFLFSHRAIQGRIASVDAHIDIHELGAKVSKDGIALNDIAEVSIQLQEAVPLDTFEQHSSTGSFIMIDRISHDTVAGGMIRSIDSVNHRETNETASEFELELNQLIRKHFPHWQALDVRKQS